VPIKRIVFLRDPNVLERIVGVLKESKLVKYEDPLAVFKDHFETGNEKEKGCEMSAGTSKCTSDGHFSSLKMYHLEQ